MNQAELYPVGLDQTELDHQMRAAIDWMLRLDSPQAGLADYQAFDIWLQADRRHPEVWQQVSGLLQQSMADLKATETSQRPAPRPVATAPVYLQRRTLLRGSLALLLMGLGSAALVNRITPLEGLIADRHTATGERRTVQLIDGSRLILDARSAVDIQFNNQRRLVRLQQGRVAVSVADSRRPFIVATEQGEIRGFGSRFTVRLDEGRTQVAVQHNSVRLDTRAGYRGQLDAGHTAWLSGNGILAAEPTLFTRSNWTGGLLDVRDEPLGRVIEALRPYYPGVMRISDAAAQRRVTGVLALDDPMKTLRDLAQTLPLEISQYGRFLTRIEHR